MSLPHCGSVLPTEPFNPHSPTLTLVSTLSTLLFCSLSHHPLLFSSIPFPSLPLLKPQDSIAHTTARMQASDLLHRGLFSPTHLAAMEAVKSHLMMNFDGTLQPLTLRQRLLYSSRQALLEAKISRVRAKAKEIEDEVEEIEVEDNNLKDILLLRRYCTALHCTALHCTALYCTALYGTVLHCTVRHCTALHCTALYCIALYCTALHCTVLRCTALYWTALHCTALYCTLLCCIGTCSCTCLSSC
jgi:hypothetical protein